MHGGFRTSRYPSSKWEDIKAAAQAAAKGESYDGSEAAVAAKKRTAVETIQDMDKEAVRDLEVTE